MSERELHQVVRFIDSNFRERLTVRRLASQIPLSPFHFARLFKEFTGSPPHEFLVRRRISAARELLRGTTKPLKVVATEVGFRTQAHFSQVFRVHTGTTPGRYRAAAFARVAND